MVVAFYYVGQGVADSSGRALALLTLCRVRQREVFDVVAQGVVDIRPDGVTATIEVFLHDIAEAVDEVEIVSFAARHGVVAGAAYQPIVGDVARQPVVQGIADGGRGAELLVFFVNGGQHQILDIVAEGVIDKGHYCVITLIETFLHDIAEAVDDVRIIAFAAAHGVVASAANHRVAAIKAVNDVAARTAYQQIAQGCAIYCGGSALYFVSDDVRSPGNRGLSEVIAKADLFDAMGACSEKAFNTDNIGACRHGGDVQQQIVGFLTQRDVVWRYFTADENAVEGDCIAVIFSNNGAIGAVGKIVNIAATPPLQGVVAEFRRRITEAHQRVIARAANELVAALQIHQQIGAFPALELVIAALIVECVVAAIAI